MKNENTKEIKNADKIVTFETDSDIISIDVTELVTIGLDQSGGYSAVFYTNEDTINLSLGYGVSFDVAKQFVKDFTKEWKKTINKINSKNNNHFTLND